MLFNSMSSPLRANAVAKIKKVLANVRERRRVSNNARAHINATYTLTVPKITGRTLTIKYPFSHFSPPFKLPRGFISMDGRRTLSSLPIARVTKTHGLVGDVSNVNHWYIKTTNGAAIIHKTGTTQITAKSVGRVAEQLERVYPGISNANVMRVTKFDARMSIGRYLVLERIGDAYPALTFYEPELRNRAEVKWPSPSMKLMFYQNGQVQIFGASKPANAVDVVRQIIEKVTPQRLFVHVEATNIAGRPIGYEMKYAGHAPESRKEKLAKNALKKLNVRHPPVSGYNHVPNAGRYVRPGPNGKPRLYNIKGNMSLSAKKITKAYEEAGVNMPQYVKNLIGSAFVFYGASKAANRAPAWNSKKNGYYVAPGVGKQPHFYKLPAKNLKGGFETAKARYNKAGMNVPQHVRNLFGAGYPSSSPVLNRPNAHVVQNNKVNGKTYKKLTTAQLVAIARNLGNAGASNGMTKNVLFERIKSRAIVKPTSPARAPNVTVNGRTYIFSNDPLNQRILRNGRKRVFSTLEKAEREAIARAYLGNNYKTVKPKNWYNTMRGKKSTG